MGLARNRQGATGSAGAADEVAESIDSWLDGVLDVKAVRAPVAPA